MFRRDAELDVKVHYVQDQVKFVEVDLVLEQGVAVATNLDKELVLNVLRDLGVFQPLQVVYGLEH